MALSLLVNPSRFFKEFNPHLGFRFEVEFFGLPTESSAAKMQYAVENIKISGTECDSSKGAFYLGNATTKTFPVYNISTRSIQISFEETDDMDILKTLDSITNLQRSNLPYVVGIRVKEFNPQFSKIVSDKYYTCILNDYTEPTFARAGGVQIVKTDATFMIMSEKKWQSVPSNVQTGSMIAQFDNGIDDNVKNYAIESVNYVTAAAERAKQESELNRNDKFYTGVRTKDFIVDEEEVNGIYNKIKAKTNVRITDGTLQGFNFLQSEESQKNNLRDVLTTNAELMKNAYQRLSETLKASNITVSINAYNDSGHAVGLGTGSGSHLLGQKIDLTFSMNGKKLTADGSGGSKKLDAATLNTIINAAKSAGLVANWEKSGEAGSTWGDFALDAKSDYNSGKMKTITKDGHVTTLNKNNNWRSWTGENRIFDTSQNLNSKIT